MIISSPPPVNKKNPLYLYYSIRSLDGRHDTLSILKGEKGSSDEWGIVLETVFHHTE